MCHTHSASLMCHTPQDTSLPSGKVSSSTSGNVLEAINLALNGGWSLFKYLEGSWRTLCVVSMSACIVCPSLHPFYTLPCPSLSFLYYTLPASSLLHPFSSLPFCTLPSSLLHPPLFPPTLFSPTLFPAPPTPYTFPLPLPSLFSPFPLLSPFPPSP